MNQIVIHGHQANKHPKQRPKSVRNEAFMIDVDLKSTRAYIYPGLRLGAPQLFGQAGKVGFFEGLAGWLYWLAVGCAGLLASWFAGWLAG